MNRLVVLAAVAGCGRIEFAHHDAAAAVTTPTCPAQGCTVTTTWAKRFGSSAIDYGFDVSWADGDLLVTGFYAQSSVDFGGGPLGLSGIHDVMAVVLDRDGNHRRSRGFGGAGIDEAFAFERAGNLELLVGRATDGAQFGSGSLAGGPGLNAFVAAFDATGAPRWSRMLGGSGDDVASDVVIDTLGNVYVAGEFATDVDASGTPVTAIGSSDIFVVAYGADGAFRWQLAFGGDGADVVRKIALSPDGARLYTLGVLDGTFAGVATSGDTDLLLGVIDTTTGTMIDSLMVGGTGADGGSALAVDADGNLYVTAFFSDSVTLQGQPFTSAGGNDLLLFSMDAALQLRWASAYGGAAGTDRGIDVTIGLRGELVVGGTYTGVATIGTSTLASIGGTDAFVLATDLEGTPLWTFAFGGNMGDEVQSVAVDESGSVFATGAFRDTASLGAQQLTSLGGIDTFVLRLDADVIAP